MDKMKDLLTSIKRLNFFQENNAIPLLIETEKLLIEQKLEALSEDEILYLKTNYKDFSIDDIST